MPAISSSTTVQRKMALQMLILTKTGRNTSADVYDLVRALEEPLKRDVTDELKKMVNMTLDELTAEFNKSSDLV